jgi:hypothetical protein
VGGQAGVCGERRRHTALGAVVEFGDGEAHRRRR